MRSRARLVGKEDSHLLDFQGGEIFAQMVHDGGSALIALERMHLRRKIARIEPGQYRRAVNAIAVGTMTGSARRRQQHTMTIDGRCCRR